ncbi:MAG: hypothetical protein KIT76_06790, partial [Pseudolabrys sp.]|nr:hypothetical protein [Pseudolabrys sp.]
RTLYNSHTTLKVAREERAADQKALVRQLKRLTVEEFVRLPPTEWQDLTTTQYDDVVKHIAPGHKLPQPPTEPSKPPQWRLREAWKATPSWLQAAVAALLAGLPMLIAALLVVPAVHRWQYQTPPVRSIDASTWPRCTRLNKWVDGCIYVPTTALTWERTAGLLAIAEAELRQANRHLHENYVPAGATIIVWRKRGILQGDNP